ncbi:MAG: HEAT repeat domain-containing protein [Coriobacteriia bacterium]|nr:HEAT repeat domain-containing protein [Coriobacteriia bacterium]
MGDRAQVSAEEVVRALGMAAAAMRLYPPTSELPAQALQRAAEMCAAITAQGTPIRFMVEPKAFKIGDQLIGETMAQVSGFAEILYAHQVGQLIVAPGLSDHEIKAFLRCTASDASAVREEGGLRTVLGSAGVTHIAVIELTLRASTEEGLAGIDLTSAPLDVIGPAIVRAAADWARSAANGTGADQVADAIGSLETAARELAASRIAEALSRLDEQTRSAVVAAAMRQDTSGTPMKGMLDVVAGMKPATLARLLTLAANRTGGDAISVLGKLELPPEAMEAVMLLLRPNPRSESDSGVPPHIDPDKVAADATEEDEEDEPRLRAQVAAASPSLAAARALGTALALARRMTNAGTVEAVGDALGPAFAAGAFGPVTAAARMLTEAAADPSLETSVRKARLALGDADVLAHACARVRDAAVAASAGPAFAAAGAAGAEALLAAWAAAHGASRQALEDVLRADADQVLVVAGRRVRTGDPNEAREVVGLLGRLGDRRSAPVLAQALDSASSEVRSAAIETLAKLGNDDAWAVVSGALHHPDEPTARRALYEVRMARNERAVQDLVATLTSPLPARSWEFKREVVDCLKELHASEAVPALKREAGHIFAFTAKRRMLRQAARDALVAIRAAVPDTDDTTGRMPR